MGVGRTFRGDHSTQGLIELEGADSDGDGLPDLVDPWPLDPLNNFDLREAGADGVFDTADDVIYRVRVDPVYTSGTSVGLVIEDGPLGNGHYRFTANSTLLDRSGNALDGNGDGSGGDAYMQVFNVALPAGFVFEGRGNETQQTATMLSLTEDPPGSGLFVGRGMGSVQTTSDQDWWSFTALAGDMVSVAVDRYQDSGLTPYVVLRNSGGGGIDSAYDGGAKGALLNAYTIPTSGTYYVTVQYRLGQHGELPDARGFREGHSDGERPGLRQRFHFWGQLRCVGAWSARALAGDRRRHGHGSRRQGLLPVGHLKCGECGRTEEHLAIDQHVSA